MQNDTSGSEDSAKVKGCRAKNKITRVMTELKDLEGQK
jgi:hypothetical protein